MDLSEMTVPQYINFINKKTDVNKFMKLRGIDVTDEKDRLKIADQGNQIRKYFDTRNEIMRKRSVNYTAVKDDVLTGIGNHFMEKKQETTKDDLNYKPEKFEKQFTSDNINKEDEMLTFKSMSPAIESELKKNPIRIPNMGLNGDFNLFFPTEKKKSTKIYKSLANKQIAIDSIFLQ